MNYLVNFQPVQLAFSGQFSTGVNTQMFKTIKQHCITVKNFLLYLHEVRKSKPNPDKLDILTFVSLEEADRRLNRTRHPDGRVIYNRIGEHEQ